MGICAPPQGSGSGRAFGTGYAYQALVRSDNVSTVTIGTAGVTSALRDSTDKSNILFTGTLTADITVSGVGGLDVGVEAANTWYAVHVIAGPGMATAALLSLSATAPTLPVGYTRFRRVGWVRNNGASNFIAFKQEGANAYRQATFLDSIVNRQILAAGAGAAGAGIAVSAASFVPPTSRSGVLQVRQNSALVGAVFGRDVGGPFLLGVLGGNDLFTDRHPLTAAQALTYTNLALGGAVDIWVLGYNEDI